MPKPIEPELKEKIKGHLASSDNVRETARHFKVSPSTVMKIRDEAPDAFEQLRTDKKQEMIEKLWDNIVDAASLGHKMIKEANEGKRDIPLGQVSTYFGTLYDKHALMTGGKTAEVGATITLEGAVKEWAK